MSALKDCEEAMVRCMKCGECQAVCPTFATTGREGDVARGKVRLIKGLLDGELKPSKNLAEKLSSCLLCKACSATCPSGVEVDRLIVTARGELASKLGMSFTKGVFLNILEHPRLLPFMAACARSLRLIPSSSRTRKPSFRTGNPKSRKGAKAVFYAGCVINYAYPEVGAAVMEILRRAGVSAATIKEKCCGLPAYYAGSMGKARALAEYNLAKFEGSETIVTACPSCTRAFKEYPRFFTGELREKALRLSMNTWDISEFLFAIGGMKDKLGELKERVTYHSPCHALYGLGVAEEPRKLAKLIPGLELVEMRQGCCGFGGLFSFEHPSLARMINDKKIKEISETKAGAVVTSCPGCKYYLQKGLWRHGQPSKALHIAELLAMALKSED